MVATLKIPLERRNERTGGERKSTPLEITTAGRSITGLGKRLRPAAAAGNDVLSAGDTHTFRHNYAILHAVRRHTAGAGGDDGAQVDQLDRGCYTKVFALVSPHGTGCSFQMPGACCGYALKGTAWRY